MEMEKERTISRKLESNICKIIWHIIISYNTCLAVCMNLNRKCKSIQKNDLAYKMGPLKCDILQLNWSMLERMKEIVFSPKMQFSVCFGNGSIACLILAQRQQDKCFYWLELNTGQRKKEFFYNWFKTESLPTSTFYCAPKIVFKGVHTGSE